MVEIQIHLTAKIYVFCSPSNVNQGERRSKAKQAASNLQEDVQVIEPSKGKR